MPLYNVEETLSIALDSILMQDVDFSYEIICINDASTDSTLNILNNYAQKFAHIKVFTNEQNIGNGRTFARGLKEASGDYFIVLDGDDFYTVKNKLQKQVDFLDSDIKNEYCAVCHKYLRLYEDNTIAKDYALFINEKDFYYSDLLSNMFYAHTSSMMYRNIFKHHVPDFFHLNTGETPRTFLVLHFTQGKVRYLNFVGSVYRHNSSGIWTSLDRSAQIALNIKNTKLYIDFCFSHIEKKLWARKTNKLKGNSQPQEKALESWCVSQLFKFVKNIASNFAFKHRDFAFHRTYKSEFLDSLIESLGRIELNSRELSPLKTIVENDNIAISIAMLNNTGGGIYREIHELIEINAHKNIFIIFSEITNEDNLPEQIIKDFAAYKHVKLLFCKEQGAHKLKCLFDLFLTYNISKVYHYAGHNFPYNAALIQQGIYKNIILFSIDHGFALALDNSSVDNYITKTPAQYKLLHNNYKNKVIYIPIAAKEICIEGQYVPFNNHEFLITATAAARFYKFNNNEINYINFIIALLKKTGGKHIHYGPIDEESKNKIYIELENNHISSDSFVHIEWAQNLCQDLLNSNVDLFISSFPLGSGKTLLSVFSHGIPIICYRGQTLASCIDFVYPEALFWTSHQEFLAQIQGLTKEKLLFLSVKGKEYFHKNNNIELLADFLYQEKQFTNDIPHVYCSDTEIIDVSHDPYFFPLLIPPRDEGERRKDDSAPVLTEQSKLIKIKTKLARIYNLSAQLTHEIFFIAKVKNIIKGFYK